MFGRRILILIPHPDDEVVGCCAAIGRARAQGAEAIGVCLTTGVPAREVFWPWQRIGHAARVARRREEASRAADLLGINLVSLAEIPTRQLKSHIAPTLAAVRDHIRRIGADRLWTPAYEGGHQDHDVANFIASRLRSEVNVWEFSEYNLFGGKVRSQEFFAPNGSEREIALTRDEQRFKRSALRLYASEKGNLSYVRNEREVFRPLAEYDYSRPPHGGKLFYQRFQWTILQTRVDYTQPEEVCCVLEAGAQNTRSEEMRKRGSEEMRK
ncbi:MAG: PIG-L deacetylase family protein [Candidatus Acidiferrales bacterium]